MRIQSYRNIIAIPTGYWLDVIVADIKKIPHLPSHFHMDVIRIFFNNFNQILHRGRHDFLEGRRGVKEELIAMCVADLEGSYISRAGHPQPIEFELPELEIVVLMTCYLYDDFLMAVDNACLDSSAEIEFMRLAGYDILFRYQSYRHPFQGPEMKQLGVIRRAATEDMTDDLEPVRRWI